MLLPDDFVPGWSSPKGGSANGLWFVFREGRLLVAGGEGARLPAGPGAGPPVPVEGVRCVGLLDERPCWTAQAVSESMPSGIALEPLRGLFDRLSDGLLAVAGRAAQLLEFDRTHRHCGACATPIYSALAGFVEPSETLEACVHREVSEEVGVRVRNLRYFGSQSWPFPHSLMVAFLCEHDGGEIACDPAEIVDAQWFPVGRLPLLPHRLSVARRLIEHAVAEAGAAPG